MKIQSKEHKLAVIIWNEYIAQAMNKKIDFSFDNLEDRIVKELNRKWWQKLLNIK